MNIYSPNSVDKFSFHLSWPIDMDVCIFSIHMYANFSTLKIYQILSSFSSTISAASPDRLPTPDTGYSSGEASKEANPKIIPSENKSKWIRYVPSRKKKKSCRRMLLFIYFPLNQSLLHTEREKEKEKKILKISTIYCSRESW